MTQSEIRRFLENAEKRVFRLQEPALIQPKTPASLSHSWIARDLDRGVEALVGFVLRKSPL